MYDSVSFKTRYNSLIQTVIHESDGYFSWEQLLAAAQGVKKLVSHDCAAVWDLRKSAAISPDLDFFYAAKAACVNDFQDIAPPDYRCAFVVADTKEHSRVTEMLHKLSPPWNWSVQTEMSEALAWVGAD